MPDWNPAEIMVQDLITCLTVYMQNYNRKYLGNTALKMVIGLKGILLNYLR